MGTDLGALNGWPVYNPRMGDEFEDPFAMLKPPPEPVPPPPEHDEGLDGILALFDEPVPPPSVTTDPEGQVQRILAEVPEADPTYVRDLVSRSSDAFIDAMLAIKSKRARFVLMLLLRDRTTTTDDVRVHYDPMAIRDLEGWGIPLRKSFIKGRAGRNTTEYSLDPLSFEALREARCCLSAKAREDFFASRGCCALCGSTNRSYLQADHRVPFLVVGNLLMQTEGLDAFQPLCPSCNTLKEDVCVLCSVRVVEFCRTCYWAYPEKYEHVAGKRERRLTFVAQTPESLVVLDELRQLAVERGLSVA